MIRRLAFLLAVLLPGLGAAHGAEPGRRPNVLLVSFDDLGDWIQPLEAHTYASTPPPSR